MSPDSDRVPAPAALSRSPEADPALRLARLRPEFAAHYPGLDAGSWYPAASVAAYFRAWLTRHPDRRLAEPLRGLDTGHFDFRGGVPREAPWLPGHSADEREPQGQG